MSNNVTAGAGGSVMGMISFFIQSPQVQTASTVDNGSVMGVINMFIQSTQVQAAIEVFAYGILGGIAGIVGKVLAEWIVKKIRKIFKIEPKHKRSGK
jgi:hypothetical protein